MMKIIPMVESRIAQLPVIMTKNGQYGVSETAMAICNGKTNESLFLIFLLLII